MKKRGGEQGCGGGDYKVLSQQGAAAGGVARFAQKLSTQTNHPTVFSDGVVNLPPIILGQYGRRAVVEGKASPLERGFVCRVCVVAAVAPAEGAINKS